MLGHDHVLGDLEIFGLQLLLSGENRRQKHKKKNDRYEKVSGSLHCFLS
jgi:hypothetical protein